LPLLNFIYSTNGQRFLIFLCASFGFFFAYKFIITSSFFGPAIKIALSHEGSFFNQVVDTINGVIIRHYPADPNVVFIITPMDPNMAAFFNFLQTLHSKGFPL